MSGKDERRLPYGHQSIDDSDIESVIDALKSDWLTTGPRVAAFEDRVAEYVGVKHGVAVSSGTSALLCACQAADLSESNEVAVPTLTFAATASAARLCGAEVRFTDIDPETWGMSALSLESVLSEKTKVVLPVDFAGQPCDWTELNALLEGRKVTTIADGAHAIGARFGDQAVGALADMTCFSFHPVKTVTTAEGGMIVTESDDLAEKLSRIRNHGIVRSKDDFLGGAEVLDGDANATATAPWYYEVQEPGLNHRMSDVQSALGVSQLKKLNSFISRRSALAERYTKAFAQSDLLETPIVRAGRQSAWHLYVIRLNLGALAKSRRQVFDDLTERGLGVQVHYMPLHLQPYYSKRYGHSRGDFPIAEDYYDRAITLPLYPAMTDDDADRVIETVLDVLRAAKR